MSRLTKKKKEHIGLSPYALIFRGQKKTEETLVRAFNMDINSVEEKDITTTQQLSELKNSRKLSWINIDGVDNAELMECIASVFQIDASVLSDVMNPSIRPSKVEFTNGLFATIKMLKYDDLNNTTTVENLSLIITNGTLISFQEQQGDVFEPIRERIRYHKNKIRISGADYLGFTLLDVVVDNYIYIIGLLGEKIEALDNEITSNTATNIPDKTNAYKRELNILRKHIKPAREMINSLAKSDSDFLNESNRQHYRELLENINEASELTDTYRDMLNDQQNMYHAIMGTRLNEIMRILTTFSVVFIPLTFIVGVYGTNFRYIPELEWKYGYMAMWSVMGIIAVLMLWFFKQKKWF